MTGYTARVDHAALGQMLSAFVAITPLDPSQPDDAPARLEHIEAIESCHSVAGEESYVLMVRVASPRDLEELLQQIPHGSQRADAKHHHLTDILRGTALYTVIVTAIADIYEKLSGTILI